ncbi:MAG: hypothetical protein N2483_05905, partial [Burkholderiaceae bacterium]|nr:hypothetical protein [Burkholderiaceae bacterium]
RWAKTIQQPPDLRAAADIIDAFDERLRADAAFARSVYGDLVWGRAVEQVLDPLFGERGKSVPPAVATNLLATVSRLEQHGVEVQRRLMAEIYFAAEDFARAASLWEQAGEKRSRRYLMAKAQSTAYPDCINYFRQLEDRPSIVAAFDAHRQTPLSTSQARVVARALTESGRYADALACLGETTAAEVLIEIARAALAPAPEAALSALRRAVIAAATTGDWDTIGRLIAEPQTLVDLSSIGFAGEERLKRWVPELRMLLVRALARSDALAETTAFAQRDAISQFLRDFLRGKDKTRIGSVSLLEAGAAVERASRFIDSLHYYESLLRSGRGQVSDDERAAIQRRWLVVKRRQLEFEESRGTTDGEVLNQIRRDIAAAEGRWRIDPDEWLPRFPDLDPLPAEPVDSTQLQSDALRVAVASAIELESKSLLKPQLPIVAAPPPEVDARATPAAAPAALATRAERTSLAAATEFKAGDLRFEVQRDQRRCLVTHLASLETVRVEWLPRRVSGTLDARSSGGDGEQYEIDAWNLSIQFAERSGQAYIIFCLDSEAIEVALGP